MDEPQKQPSETKTLNTKNTYSMVLSIRCLKQAKIV